MMDLFDVFAPLQDCLLTISSPSLKGLFQTLSNPICNQKIEARSDSGGDIGGGY